MTIQEIIEKEFFYKLWYIENGFSEMLIYPFRWGRHSINVAHCYYYFREYNILNEPIESSPWIFSNGIYRFNVYEFFKYNLKEVNQEDKDISIEKDLAKFNLAKHI